MNHNRKIDLRYPENSNDSLHQKDIYIIKEKTCCETICCHKSSGIYNEHYEHVFEIIKQMNINTFKKRIIIARFINLIKKINKQVCTVSYTYQILKFFQQTGSILLPSVLSIQGISGASPTFTSTMYWGTWGLSLAIGLLTNWIHLFKLDKKFILYSSVKSKLEQEFWLFISLTGRYNIIISHKKKCAKIKTRKGLRHRNVRKQTRKATHKDTIDLFLERVEQLYKQLSSDEEGMLLDGIDQKEDEDDEEEGSISEDSATSAVHIGTQMTGIDEDDCVNLDIIDDDDDNIFKVVNSSGEDDLKTNQQIELTELPIKKENIVINIRDEIDINTTDDLTGSNI
jgi:hypothetical protein